MTKRYVLHTFYSDGSDAGGTTLKYTFDQHQKLVAEEIIRAVDPIKQYEVREVEVPVQPDQDRREPK